MAYKVFVSHSARDQGLVVSLANLLWKFGVEPVVAQWYLTPGDPLDSKVMRQIGEADCLVVLLTRHGIRSNWVQQEIGLALKEGKPIIPLVEVGIEARELAILQGREYISYDPFQPQHALLAASSYVQSLHLKKAEQEKALLVTGGILAFLLLLSGGEK